jgi:hypothetical protein
MPDTTATVLDRYYDAWSRHDVRHPRARPFAGVARCSTITSFPQVRGWSVMSQYGQQEGRQE